MTNLFVRSGISFVDRSEVLTHIGNEMLAKGVVYDTWPQALIAREAEFPTGIMLEQHAIAIPHCEAIHAKSSAIYLLRPTNKVHFQQADVKSWFRILRTPAAATPLSAHRRARSTRRSTASGCVCAKGGRRL